MQENHINVSLIVTFHSEGVLAHLTLNSIERCRLFAKAQGITSEYIWVIDNADNETKRILEAYQPSDVSITRLYVDNKDAGASRNSGIAVAKGEAIAIFDGDDYYSTNWIASAWSSLRQFGSNAIVHPEFIMNFDSVFVYGWQVDQDADYFNVHGLLTNNFWTSAWTMAFRETYLNVPYVPTHVLKTGFAFEDWQWNCETVAAGYKHKLAPQTIGFYRRKQVSRITQEIGAGGIMLPSKLFDKIIGNV